MYHERQGLFKEDTKWNALIYNYKLELNESINKNTFASKRSKSNIMKLKPLITRRFAFSL